jgi:hypothetical protein
MTERTLVDVADKAVDSLTSGVVSLAAVVQAAAAQLQQAAPGAWSVYVRQHYTDGASRIGYGLATFLVGVIAPLFGAWIAQGHPAGFASGFFITLVLWFVAGDFIREGVLRLRTPEYYAAEELLATLRRFK